MNGAEDEKKQWRLVHVEYQPDKRRILASFRSPNGCENRAFPFFPRWRLPKNPNRVEEIRSSAIRGLQIKTEKNFIEISAPTLEPLRALAAKLAINENEIFSPERTFLLLKNWHIGDVFDVELEKKRDNPLVPPPGFDWPYSPLATWKAFLLQVPVAQLPAESFDDFEVWIGNRFFENNLPIPPVNPSRVPTPAPTGPSPDWSRVWKIAFEHGLNPGFESVNCSCCNENETGLLPSSLARFCFDVDGVFFVSQFEWFAKWFHETQPNPQARLRFQQEQHLPLIPSGPYYRNMQTILPLADAQALVEDRLGKIESIPESHHWCKKPSFLVEHVKAHSQLERAYVRRLLEIERQAFQTDQLGAFHLLETNLEYRQLSRFVDASEEWFSGLFSHLLQPRSRFYSNELANALSSHHELWWPHWKNTIRQHNTIAFHHTPAEIARVCQRIRSSPQPQPIPA